jgi:hypothetical protein
MCAGAVRALTTSGGIGSGAGCTGVRSVSRSAASRAPRFSFSCAGATQPSKCARRGGAGDGGDASPSRWSRARLVASPLLGAAAATGPRHVSKPRVPAAAHPRRAPTRRPAARRIASSSPAAARYTERRMARFEVAECNTCLLVLRSETSFAPPRHWHPPGAHRQAPRGKTK